MCGERSRASGIEAPSPSRNSDGGRGLDNAALLLLLREVAEEDRMRRVNH